MRKISPRLILLTFFMILLVTVFPAAAETVTINFDRDTNGNSISSFSWITNQYQSLGVTFVGSTVVPSTFYAPLTLTGTSSWPAKSTPNVLYSPYNPMVKVNFASPVSNVGFYYTLNYGEMIFKAYDSSNTLLGEASGILDYEKQQYISISAENIAYITITGDSEYMGYFFIDDLTFTTTSTPIPEFPNVAIPVAGIIGLLFIYGRKKAGM